MIPTNEKKILEKFLRLSPDPDATFNYDELCGFLFGLAMTPEFISPSEWIPLIFGGEVPQFKKKNDPEEMIVCLSGIYNRLVANFHGKSLPFPFDLNTFSDDQFETVYGWVSGFEEALALREELWDPEEFPKLANRKKEDLMHSIMTIQGLIDPTDVIELFENLPEDVFKETFPNADQFPDREVQIQVFLLASLPLAIETLQSHAQALEKKRSKKTGGKTIPIPIRSGKPSNDQPCSCPGGGTCCGSPPPAEKKKSNIIKVDFPQHGKKRPAAPIYQLKISLQGTKPPVWRRIQVPADTTLGRLHKIIQLCMGWTDSHLHQFIIDRTSYCRPDMDDDMDDNRSKDEKKFTLQTLEKKLAEGFLYIYDFGDDWIHKITVEKILTPSEGKPYPLLVTGKRACPPEDIGGIPGFAHLLEILDNPEDPNHDEYVDWLDEEYDPARFGKEEIALINAVLEEMYG